MIYVDTLLPCVPNRNWRWHKSCHLFVPTPGRLHEEELHAFARRISLRRTWFQNKPEFPHYDLNGNKRLLAIEKGAVEVSREEVRETLLRFCASNNGRLA